MNEPLRLRADVLGDGHTVTIRTCSVTDWGSQCGDIFFEQGEDQETLRGCLATCNFDGCNGAVHTTSQLTHRRCLLVVAALATVALATVATTATRRVAVNRN